MKFRTSICVALLLIGTSARATEFKTIDVGASRLGFVYKQMGVAMDGRFAKFNGRMLFDPTKPSQGSANLELDLASIDTGTEADAEVQGKAWFNSAAFPKATFTSTQIVPTGPGTFDVQGKLTIKGKTVDLRAPVRFTEKNAVGTFQGSFTIRRADFAIGEGSWSKFDVVANEIRIDFFLVARPGR